MKPEPLELTPLHLAEMRAILQAGFRGRSIVRGWESPTQRQLEAHGLVYMDPDKGNWKFTLSPEGKRQLKAHA